MAKQKTIAVPMGNTIAEPKTGVQDKMFDLRKSALPVVAKGTANTSPMMSISDGGQIRFNGAATRVLMQKETDPAKVRVFFIPGEGRALRFTSDTKVLPKSYNPATDGFSISVSSKSRGAYLGAAGVWRVMGYDYKASGTQVFDLTTQGTVLQWDKVPEGALPLRPMTKRPNRKQRVNGNAGGPTPPAEVQMVNQ